MYPCRMFRRLVVLLTLVAGDDELLVVKTSTGWIRGIERNGVVGFLGVPFASPPTGSLRFAKPIPHPAWDDGVVRNATRSGPTCVQGTDPTGQEDCLVLNVFTTRPKVPQPVVFDIHGGGFVSGSAKNDSFSWRSVVLVAPQYRLGVFGFACNDICENFGLADQRLALVWTAKNAEAFGGDPSRILIMGGSAGGASVAGMLVSPFEVTGLFHAASLESPGGHQGWMGNDERSDDDWMSQALRVNHTKRLVALFHCQKIEDLREMDAATLWLEARTLRLAPSIVDENGDDDYPLRRIRKGQWMTTAQRVPVVVGGVSCESCQVAEAFLGPPRDNVTQSEFRYALRSFLANAASRLTALDLEAWYFERIQSEGRWRTFARILSDSGHACSSALHALAFANSTQTWRYFFEYTGDSDALPGATHGSEHLYILDEGQPLSLSDRMANWWARFANTANPNGFLESDDNSVWSSFDNESSLVMYMNTTPSLGSSTLDTERPECLRHWAQYLGW